MSNAIPVAIGNIPVTIAELSILYTGGCVKSPPMEVGDVVRIDLEGVGFVENTVIQV